MIDNLFSPIQTLAASDVSLNLSQSAINNFTDLTRAASSSVSALTDYVYATFLPQVMSLSTSLRGNQTALCGDQTALCGDQLLTEIVSLNGEILSAVPATSREQCKLNLMIITLLF